MALQLLRSKLHFELLAGQIGGRTDTGEAIASSQCYRDMMIQTLHSFCIKRKCCCIDSFSQEARSSPVERAQGSSAALRASLKLGMPARQLRRGCAAGKILDGKAFGGRCAGQKSWRGTHVVLLCFLRKVLCYSRQST